MRAHPLLIPLVAASLFASAFAGCLAQTSSGEPTISRVHTLTLTRETAEKAESHSDDPVAALRELLTTELVVRVKEEGDYLLEFTDPLGNPRSQAIVGATPATPVVVSGADPLAPAVLKRGADTITVRAGIAGDWWHVGDLPLGFNLTGSSKTTYDFRARMQETLTLTDLDLTEMDVSVQNLAFDLLIPIEGSASWELQPDTGDGSPVLLAADMHLPAGAGDLLTLDVAATQAGVPGTAGIIAGADEARASASAKVWVKDGQPIAAQFLGGEAKFTPRTAMWADGFFADLAQDTSCAGASKADRCSPEEVESFEESAPAGEKESAEPAEYPRAETDEERAALALIQRLFAQDILVGDKAIVIVRGDSDDLGATPPDGPTGDALLEFTIEAVEIEEINIPAGSFDALKIVEQMRTTINLNDVPGPDGETIVSRYAMDETIARTTFWLDATTYQPLKMEATTPFSADAILKNAFNSIEPTAWDQIGGKPIEDSQWSFTAVAESSYEAAEFEPGAHFSALVGLGLAHAVTGTMGASPMSWWMMGFGGGFGQGFGSSYAEPARPVMALSLTSAAPAADGLKSYIVAAASEGMTWGDLMITVDGADLYLEAYAEECADPEEGFTVCRGATPIDYYDDVFAGDVLTLMAQPGQTVRVLDPYSNSVILTLTVS